MTRVAIVTPYYQETQALLERCLSSVRRQTLQADHFMVADGHPQDWIDAYCRSGAHIRLNRSHGDAGNAARALGALLAIAEDYEAIGLLDADNWLEPDHVETCLAVAGGRCDYVVAKRVLRRPDESVMPLADNWPFDTNCLFFLRGAFFMLPQWAMIPLRHAKIGDRVFHGLLAQQDLTFVQTDHPTVNYHNLWAASYRALGEPLPPGAKESVRL